MAWELDPTHTATLSSLLNYWWGGGGLSCCRIQGPLPPLTVAISNKFCSLPLPLNLFLGTTGCHQTHHHYCCQHTPCYHCGCHTASPCAHSWIQPVRRPSVCIQPGAPGVFDTPVLQVWCKGWSQAQELTQNFQHHSLICTPLGHFRVIPPYEQCGRSFTKLSYIVITAFGQPRCRLQTLFTQASIQEILSLEELVQILTAV